MNNAPLLLSCEILENIELNPKYFLLKLNSPELASSVKPGQFFHIRVSDRLDIPLRRPFSVYDSNENSVSILYEIVGKGTRALSQRKHGEELDVLGPLGNGFTISRDELSSKEAIVVGGGMGVAPLFSLVKDLKKENIKTQVLLGFNNKYNILCEKDFKKIGVTPQVSTDDGSYGHKGMVTDLLKERVKDERNSESRVKIIYSCGPNNMLKEIASIMKENSLSGQLSLDRHMGCGVGVCLGCVVSGSDGKYKRVCKDGPVFNVDELEW